MGWGWEGILGNNPLLLPLIVSSDGFLNTCSCLYPQNSGVAKPSLEMLLTAVKQQFPVMKSYLAKVPRTSDVRGSSLNGTATIISSKDQRILHSMGRYAGKRHLMNRQQLHSNSCSCGYLHSLYKIRSFTLHHGQRKSLPHPTPRTIGS